MNSAQDSTPPLLILRSAAGFYIGTLDDEGMPRSRESQDYYKSRIAASNALKEGNWTPRN